VIKEISITNFKSLKKVTVLLKPVSFFCGPNASGKTNLAEALDFLSQVFRGGLQYAVAEKGGFYNICFRRMRRTKGAIGFSIIGSSNLPKLGRVEFDFRFSFGTHTEAIRADFLVESEHYQFTFFDEMAEAPALELQISRRDKGYHAEASSISGNFRKWLMFRSVDQLNEILSSAVGPRRQQLLFGPSPQFGWSMLRRRRQIAMELEGLRVFQINPRSARQPGTPSVMEGMGRHGENLPIALGAFLGKRKLTTRLNSWMQDVIPQFSQLQTKYTVTKQTGLFLQESGVGAPWYAEDLSDGTIMSLALFLCLLEPSHRTVVIEEPENSLHPWMLKRFLDRCREISNERQIIITTHSPLVVAAANPDELFLIERRQGMTEIIPAIKRDPTLAEVIRRNVLDLGDYWLSGGIGAVPEAPESALIERGEEEQRE